LILWLTDLASLWAGALLTVDNGKDGEVWFV
jgi:hypothetical protein